MTGPDGGTVSFCVFIPQNTRKGEANNMTNGSVNYNAVLADLENRKAQIESAISAVKAILAASGGGSLDGANGGVINPDDIPRGAFLRLSIADATKKYLDMVKTKQSVPQITQALERGGLPPAKQNTVYAVLRRRENDIGDIIRLGDEWALAEWYPNNPNLRRRAEKPAKAKSKHKKKAPAKKKAAAEPKPTPAASSPSAEITRVGTLFEPTSTQPPQTLTLLDGSEQILLQAGTSLHAKAIADILNERYGKNTNAGSLAGSLIQDPKKRFKNLGQNTWDLVSRSKDEAA